MRRSPSRLLAVYQTEPFGAAGGGLPVTTPEEFWSELAPIVADAARRALTRLGDHRKPRSCGHVGWRFPEVPVLCVTRSHPVVLRCPECWRLHYGRSEHPCLACGGPGVERPLRVEVGQIDVRSGEERTFRGSGSLDLAGLVVCDACRREAVGCS